MNIEQQPAGSRILLPHTVWVIRGQPLRLYYRNFVRGDMAGVIVDIECDYGQQMERCYALDTETMDARQFPLTVRLYDKDFCMREEKRCQIEILEKPDCSKAELLCFGDSMTHQGIYVGYAAKLLEMPTVGTRTMDGGRIWMEGRGGWSLNDYFEPRNADDYWSAFLFPAAVGAAQFAGSTAFWADALRERDAYPFEGFAEKAGGYTPEGFPREKPVGTVVLHQGRLLRWEGAVWEPIPDQKIGFDFAKYAQRYLPPTDKPLIVSILMGANDLQTVEEIEPAVEAYILWLKQLIAEIRRAVPAAGIILNLPVCGGPQNGWGLRMGCKGSSERYRRNIQAAAARLLNEWDTPQSRAERLLLCPMMAVLDTDYNFDAEDRPANPYTTRTESCPKDWVHPNEGGYHQMADALAATTAKLLCCMKGDFLDTVEKITRREAKFETS